MKFLKFLKNNNKGGDVGLTGMIFIMCALTVSTLALDAFANMISKQYVIEKMQAAQSYTLTKFYDTTNSTVDEVKISNIGGRAQMAYLNFLDEYLYIGNTVFNTIDFGWPRIDNASPNTAFIQGSVTYTPHQFIRNPSEALQPGVNVTNYKVTTMVRTILTSFKT